MGQKSILITGCSSGIGYDAAHGLKKRGWRVFATCRKQEDCARLEEEGLESFRLDLADEENIKRAVAKVEARTGGTLDALFNNAAFAIPGLASDLPRGAMREIFETNLFGQVDLTNRVLPMMHNQGHGRVVMNSSRLENRIKDLHFVLIEPGPVTSLIRENSRKGFEKWIDWEASPRKRFYKKTMMPRLYSDTTDKPDTFELPASAVTKKLIHAVESPRPKARYYVTTPTYMFGVLKRIVSTRMLDRMLRRV